MVSFALRSSFSDLHPNEKPDKPFIVKCKYHTRNKKITFGSAQTCTYELLKERVEEGFSLSSQPFLIKWTDDEGEVIPITSDADLTEAIQYYCRGDEEAPTSSAGSILSYRGSSSSRKITLQVQIDVDYDGPSLSDNSSLASTDDYQSHNGSQFSFALSAPPSAFPDDDAVTVSSKSVGRRKPDTLFRKLFDPSSRSPGHSHHRSTPSSTSSPAHSWDFLSEPRSARPKSEDWDVVDVNASDGASNAAPSISLEDVAARYPAHPSAVLERLKFQAQPSNSSAHDHTLLHTDRGAAWLQDQNMRTIKATLGTVPAEEDVTSLGDISLEVDHRGKVYYEYKSSASEASREYESDESGADHDIGTSSVARVFHIGTALDSPSAPAGNFETGHSVIPEGSSQRRPVSRTFNSDPFTYGNDPQAGIPPHLLVPEELTDCSECGAILDSFRYICTTCGEKKPCSRFELEAIAESTQGKGKGIAFSEETSMAYPPHGHRSSPSTSSSTTITPFADIDAESFRHMRSPSHQKPLPALPSTSPTDTVVGTSIRSHGHGHRSNSSASSSSTRIGGYELCYLCIQSLGNKHSVLSTYSNGSIHGGGETPPSPNAPSDWRRSAPRQKGQLRHAYVEKMWGRSGWEDVGAHDVHNIHPVHAFLIMLEKPARSRSVPDFLSEPSMLDAADEPSMKHPGVKCYHCMQDVVGARFRCIDCTNTEVDICSNCEAAGLPGNLDSADGGHISSHVMLKVIPMPLNTAEVLSVSRRAHRLRNSRDRVDIPGSIARSSPGSVSSSFARTVLRENLELEDHLIFCDCCGQSIIGVRYQCASCPSKPASYNLCSSCEDKSYQVHDPYHIFIKLPHPVDNHGPLQSPFPILPKLYKDAAGPPPGHAVDGTDTTAYLKDLLHKSALCDRHLTPIVGKWYRCAYCAKDLCADCEEIDEHDFTHVFIVFKAPVDMQLFK
ncbi:hypothetical protein EW146_g3752 [Bondarzewia mesenterica]|uniref:ZZ-type domain-containing protein n=1 Tax=Bondarzewia mesenterica TaxID=1095465 RepID=A0A4S4LWL5_9AGAM|nr:hypothetical protein EW146_g3752 [Bondarzewia mesenterica]